MKATMNMILTEEFFETLSLKFTPDIPVRFFIGTRAKFISAYANLKYGDVPVWHYLADMELHDLANLVYSVIGNNFERIFNALMEDYDPLENYFTIREMTTDTDGDTTKTGELESNRTGSVSNASSGSHTRTFNDEGSVGQATTFESYGNNDFRNVNKTITNGSETDTYNGLGSTTTYNNVKDNETYKNIKNTVDMTETVKDNRHGNSGIFSKQELIKKEVEIRIQNLATPVLVRLLVDMFATGVYSVDD